VGLGAFNVIHPENAEVYVRAVGATAFLDQGLMDFGCMAWPRGLAVVAHCTENGLSVMPAS
jgi:hypothetical protein